MCAERRPHGVGLTENHLLMWLGRNSKDGGGSTPPAIQSATFGSTYNGQTITNKTYNNVTITAGTFTLKNTRVKGNLTISASSNVTLDSVVVDGATIFN